MGHAAVDYRMSAPEFLRWDRAQTAKHGFVQGDLEDPAA
jgi:hypothetical protein